MIAQRTDLAAADMADSSVWAGFETISEYSRKQAIDDGVLVDVSDTKAYRDTGFRYPIALTRAVWNIVESIPASKVGWESVDARLYDLLSMMRLASRRGGDTIVFDLLMTQPHGKRKLWLKSICGPGDTAAPVITIMLPSED